MKEKTKIEQPEFGTAGTLLNGRYMAPPQDGDGQIWARRSTLIQVDATRLYQMWRDLESIPQWQEAVSKVVRTSDRTSHWTIRSPDKTIEWDSEILADEPGKRIAWRSTGGDLENAGEVIFEPAPGNRGTIVTLLQQFRLGKAARSWESVVGRSPKQTVTENLRHFKALAEAGEIPATRGQPHGPRGVVGSIKEELYGETVAVPTANRKAS